MRKLSVKDFITVLKSIDLICPVHMELENDGHGEFPDSYRITPKGGEKLEKRIEEVLNGF